MKIEIKGNPITKKNSQQLIKRGKFTKIIPSKQFLKYQEDSKAYMPNMEAIDYPCNIKVLFYMGTKRRVDLSNLISSIDDILSHYQIIEDDNRDIVAGHDGSRVYFDKLNPRAEIYVERIEDYEKWKII